MYKRLSVSEKLKLVKGVLAGEKITRVCKVAGISRTIFYEWLKKYKSAPPRTKPHILSAKNPQGNKHWRKVSKTVENKVIAIAIKNLNGQDGQDQIFSNDFNVGISSLNNIHTLFWSGLLPISRGGTGASSFTNGSIPFISNGVFSESENFVWDETVPELVLNQAYLAFKNPVGENTLSQNILFHWLDTTPFQISHEPTFDPDGGLFIINSMDRGIGIDTLNGKIIAGHAGITDFFPAEATLQVAEDQKSTLYIGSSESAGGGQHTGCLILGDSDGVGITYVTANDGVLTASATKPSICQ